MSGYLGKRKSHETACLVHELPKQSKLDKQRLLKIIYSNKVQPLSKTLPLNFVSLDIQSLTPDVEARRDINTQRYSCPIVEIKTKETEKEKKSPKSSINKKEEANIIQPGG